MILGLDPGLANTGWALLDSAGALLGAGCVRTTAQECVGASQARLSVLAAEVLPLLSRAVLAAVEWPGGGFGGHAGSAAKTAAAAGLLVGLCHGAGVRCETPAPVTWRRVFGVTSGQDEALHAELAQRYRTKIDRMRKGDIPHVLDAIGIALWARGLESK